MNFPIDPKRLRTDANLRGWSDYCREVTPDRLPKTILHVCQAVYDAVDPCQTYVPLKRKVLERVAGGDYSGAVKAMLPQGLDARFAELPHGRMLAELRHVESGISVAAEGKVGDAALLGCVLELTLLLGPEQRSQVFG